MNYRELMELGKKIYEDDKQVKPKYGQVARIKSDEKFITSHDDTAIFTRLLDKDGDVVWEDQTDIIAGKGCGTYSVALALYLRKEFYCSVELNWIGRKELIDKNYDFEIYFN